MYILEWMGQGPTPRDEWLALVAPVLCIHFTDEGKPPEQL